MNDQKPIIEMQHVKVQMGRTWVHTDVNLSVMQGEILAIVGGSGSGKTTLLREILMLQKPQSGSIRVFDEEITGMSPQAFLAIQKRWGMLFQQNALFSSLNVLENISFPLKEHTDLDPELIRELALLKLLLVGLPLDAALKYPSELSGGMQKRAALARAIIMDPELLLFDEPNAGLDPDSAAAQDELILNLKKFLGLTIVMVTHDLDTLWHVSDRVAFLGEGKVLCVAPMKELVKQPHRLIQAFFEGPRGRQARDQYQSSQE
jgi:phospholipid/cholesterol/gamma-HCH transport system ATP-binding protein